MSSQRIPRIVHQTWKVHDIPVRFEAFRQSWMDHHPGWEYRLWTDADNRELIRTRFDWFLPTYDAYPHHIQRVDAVRYFILLVHGGLYVDLDFECRQSLEPLLADHSCVLGLEPQASATLFGRGQTISNALMAATADHPFFRLVTDSLAPAFEDISRHDPQVVLETTGPFMLSHSYEAYGGGADVTLVPSRLLFPITMQEADVLRGIPLVDPVEGLSLDDARTRIEESYAVHYHFGTWWRDPG